MAGNGLCRRTRSAVSLLRWPLETDMKRLAVLLSAAVFAFAASSFAYAPDAEARRRGYGYGGGIVAAAVIGGIIATAIASRRARARPYYGYRQPYYGYSYAPAYAYSAPVYRSRPVYYSRPVYHTRSVYRARPVFVSRGYRGGGRRWR